jgi:hypothetical protein
MSIEIHVLQLNLVSLYNYNILAVIGNTCHANIGNFFVKMLVKKRFNID